MKAINKDRTRRYATANELAADVERCQNGQPVEARLSPVAFVPGTSHLRTRRGPGDTMTEWDALTGRQVAEWPAQPARGPRLVSGLSADGGWLVTADDEGVSRWRRLATGEETSLDFALKDLQQLAISPHGRLLAAVSAAGAGGLWDTATRGKIADVHGFLQGMRSVAFSPDSCRRAIGSSGEEAIKIWAVASQRELLTLEGLGTNYLATAFSPDGNLLGSSNEQGLLSFWRAPAAASTEAAPAPAR